MKLYDGMPYVTSLHPNQEIDISEGQNQTEGATTESKVVVKNSNPRVGNRNLRVQNQKKNALEEDFKDLINIFTCHINEINKHYKDVKKKISNKAIQKKKN